jgi:Fe-S-cluster-containing hydrogenase component 2
MVTIMVTIMATIMVMVAMTVIIMVQPLRTHSQKCVGCVSMCPYGHTFLAVCPYGHIDTLLNKLRNTTLLSLNDIKIMKDSKYMHQCNDYLNTFLLFKNQAKTIKITSCSDILNKFIIIEKILFIQATV